jgi:threonine/homoserine/homoserine lactone efflux protein
MGAITIELAYFTLAYFSFSFIESYINSFSVVLKIVGSAYLFYLAYSTFKKAKEIPVFANDGALQTKQSLTKDYMMGLVVTLANPLVILFYTALIPTVLDLSAINPSGLFTALSIIFFVHFVILTSQCALATQIRILLQEKVTIQKINFVSSGLLLLVALYILVSLKDVL